MAADYRVTFGSGSERSFDADFKSAVAFAVEVGGSVLNVDAIDVCSDPDCTSCDRTGLTQIEREAIEEAEAEAYEAAEFLKVDP